MSLVFKPDVVTIANRYSKIAIPSALTPTEVLCAWESGADLIKLFPSEIGGPGYVKAIKAPLPHIPLVPVGGVTLDNAADFIRAGASAVGVGGCLVKKEFLSSGDFQSLTKLCRDFVERLKTVGSSEVVGPRVGWVLPHMSQRRFDMIVLGLARVSAIKLLFF